MAKNKEVQDINENLLTGMIADCLESMDGVSRLASAGLTDSITHNVLGLDNQNHGIKISIEEKSISVNISIIVYYGVNIPQLCYDIQSGIKSLLEKEDGITVKSINVKVEGVDEKEDHI